MKKTTFLKATGVILLITLLLFNGISTYNAYAQTVTPRYNNVHLAITSADISSSGLLTVSYSVTGITNVTTKIEVTTTIEKRVLGIFWSDVEINNPTNISYNETYSFTRNFQLEDSGTYRITVQYKIYGTNGAVDEIEYQDKLSY